MDEELKSLIKVCVYAVISISYCYYVSARIKAGVFRLLSILPVCALFLVLPLFLSSVHFCASTAFFLSWLANCRLILFSFDIHDSPLSPFPPNLFKFICFTCTPISYHQNPNPKTILSKQFIIKVAILVVVLPMYDHQQHLNPTLLFVLYPLHLYLVLEILLQLFNALLSMVLDFNLEPQLNEPYLATSLKEFWGRWWNFMPLENMLLFLYPMLLSKMNFALIRYCYFFLPFIISGALHELLFFYITREPPTGEVTMFLVLHGVCMMAETWQKNNTRLQLNKFVSQVIVVGFVVVTADLLFFPPLVRSGKIQKLANEALFFIGFFNSKFFSFG